MANLREIKLVVTTRGEQILEWLKKNTSKETPAFSMVEIMKGLPEIKKTTLFVELKCLKRDGKIDCIKGNNRAKGNFWGLPDMIKIIKKELGIKNKEAIYGNIE